MTRQQAERRGRLAESIAALLLRLKGYRILAMRYKARGGEVDIVASRAGILVFVEVKARASHEAGITAVTAQARQRIAVAAERFISHKRLHPVPACRYDLITVRHLTPRHHKNAWRAGD
nr:YraN family protein [Aquisalinus flavus]